jgi:sugar phosphate isomerase/epimerase
MGEEHALHIEAVIELPEDRAGLDRLEKQILSAREAGAQVARTVVMPGRRYEQFGSAEEFARAAQRALESLQRAEPIARRHRFRLAVENHKDQRVPERLELLKRLGSEHIGMCVDVGNSFALCEDPMEVVRAYAPWVFTVHLKDQAVGEYEDGFLLADAALGKGFLDLAAMVRVLREARPEVRFNLEVITRDPLRIPVLTPKYWATMAGVPAADLARTMRTVKANTSRDGLAAVSSLSVEAQIECETRNVEASLAYARDHLRL